MGRFEELLEKLKKKEITKEELLELKSLVESRIEELERRGECEKAQKEAVILGIVEGLLQKER